MCLPGLVTDALSCALGNLADRGPDVGCALKGPLRYTLEQVHDLWWGTSMARMRDYLLLGARATNVAEIVREIPGVEQGNPPTIGGRLAVFSVGIPILPGTIAAFVAAIFGARRLATGTAEG